LLEAVQIAFLLFLELATTTATAAQAFIVIGGTGSDAALAGATGTLATALVFLDPVPTALLFLLARGSSGSRGRGRSFCCGKRGVSSGGCGRLCGGGVFCSPGSGL